MPINQEAKNYRKTRKGQEKKNETIIIYKVKIQLRNTAKIYKYKMASTREQRLIDIYTEGKVWISHMK